MKLPAIIRRSRDTIAANLDLARRRHARRRSAPMVEIKLIVEIAAIAAVAIALAMLLFDTPIVLYRGQYPGYLRDVAEVLTHIGLSGWVLIPSGVALILLTFLHVNKLSKPGRMRLFRWNLLLSYVFVGVGLPSLAATILKSLIGRPRPVRFDQDGLFGFHPIALDASYASFPSGHSTTIGALAMVLVILMPKYRTAFIIAAMIIGATRVAVGAHHPSDVIAGLMFGAVTAYVVARVAAGYGLLFKDNAGPWPELRPAHRLQRLLE